MNAIWKSNRCRSWMWAGMLGAALSLGVGRAGAQPDSQQNNNSQAARGGKVEMVFVLDTTGSMGGLIAGAKAKIWSIVNEIASAKPAPQVKIGFVAYRDKGDAYVTQVHDLTPDLDAAFATLNGFAAEGGGDMPEHVSKGLHDAVHQIHWTNAARSGDSIYQVMFLVGDCPPHTDYNDGFDYHKHAKEAIARGIAVNTVRCGNDGQTAPIWQEIARIGEGKYFSIAQNGGVVAISTPYDAEIGRIADKIEGTTVARRGRVNVNGRMMFADSAQRASSAGNAALPAASKADRAEFNAKSTQVYGAWDLTTQAMSGKAKLGDLKESELPDEIKKLPKDKRAAYLQNKIAQRKQSQAKLATLQKQRARYIANYMAQHKLNNRDAFDTLVKSTMRAQAARRKIKF